MATSPEKPSQPNPNATLTTPNGAPPTVPTASSATSSTRTEGRTPPRRNSSAKWIALGAVAALLAGGLYLRNRNAAPNAAAGEGAPGAAGAGRQQIPTARFVRVESGSITETLDVTGALRANQTVELGSKISGRVDRVLVAEGERVSRGQLLVVLDDADLRAGVAQARAGLSSAQTRLRQTIVGVPAREQQVNTGIVQAQTNLQSAQSRFRQAQLNENPRIQAAQSQVVSARETVRTANTRLAQARETARQTSLQTNADIRRAESAVSGSRAALAEVIRGAREQQIASAQAQVALAEAN